MTFAPSTPDTHDFNTTIIYTCDVGYQYSSGDLVRTCDATGNWSGAEPVCDGRQYLSILLQVCFNENPLLYCSFKRCALQN